MDQPQRRHWIGLAGRHAAMAMSLARPGTLALASLAAGRSAHARTMPLDAQEQAAHVLNRLGFGPRPGEIESVSRDVRGWIESQLQPGPAQLPPALATRLDEAAIVAGDPIESMRGLSARIQQNQQAIQAAAQAAMASASGEGGAAPLAALAPPAVAAPGGANPAPGQVPPPVAQYVRSFQGPAIASRLWRALESPRQLEEVMVDFWFNHFNVFEGKNLMRVLVGHYEHQAIRPHALGRFRDLLGATAKHPAMLYYLDNWQSVAPRGGAGRGLNENYARELMELHTLGVDAGYSQQDVTQLARMLTGWTVQPLRPAAGMLPRVAALGSGMRTDAVPGFWFNERSHDPGDKQWLGHRVPSSGQAEGEFALDVLARHPATARSIAFKLAQYFVADQPPPALVTELARVFLASDGQIVPVLRALFASQAFWSPQAYQTKFKTPYHYLLSALRAGDWQPARVETLAGLLFAQGMPLYGCPTPDGYKNTEAAWLNPDGMSKRLNLATQIAQGRIGGDRMGGGLDAAQLIAQLGPLVSAQTREVVQRHQHQPVLASALVLAGPDMMRR